MILKRQITALSRWTGVSEIVIESWYRGQRVRKATRIILLDAVREHNYPAPPHLGRFRPADIMKRVKLVHRKAVQLPLTPPQPKKWFCYHCSPTGVPSLGCLSRTWFLIGKHASK